MDSPRRSPRLSFTGRPAPRLETVDRSYEVVDLSPEGIRFRTSTATGPVVTIGDVLRATIRFPASHSVTVAGRVLRIDGGEAAVQLDDGLDDLASTVPMGPVSPPRNGLLW